MGKDIWMEGMLDWSSVGHYQWPNQTLKMSLVNYLPYTIAIFGIIFVSF